MLFWSAACNNTNTTDDTTKLKVLSVEVIEQARLKAQEDSILNAGLSEAEKLVGQAEKERIEAEDELDKAISNSTKKYEDLMKDIQDYEKKFFRKYTGT